MNYDRARELCDGDGEGIGLWHWTNKRDGRITTAEPCLGGCEHHTSEEAEQHFYNYSLDQVVEFDLKDTQKPCRVCGKWTSRGLMNVESNLWGFYGLLCDTHCNKEELKKLFPFKPNPRVTY